MFLRVKVFCTCQCEYVVDENISTAKIACPNCGLEHPYSNELLSMLNSAKKIPDGNTFNLEISNRVIPNPEYMKTNQ